MVLNFIAIALIISMLVPGSMLSAFDSPAKSQRIAQLPTEPAAQACIRFEQEAQTRRC